MTTRAFICGCAGLSLSDEERVFLQETQPWGLILFKRNIDQRPQVAQLVEEFRQIVGREDAPVLIDQEGGRVQRMGPPHWPKYPPGASFSRIAANDVTTSREIARLNARLMARDLREVGINIDCAPVLDVPSHGAHSVIGDRAYAKDAQTVAILGRATAEGLIAGGVLPVIKHIPGHGRAACDSHFELPTVTTPLDELDRADFLPFRVLADMPLAMTAHVVFSAIDPHNPATTSRKVIQDVIRDSIGFDGLLISDDLSMRALSGTLQERAQASIKSGCDIVLHCNGRMHEAQEVAAEARILTGRARKRAEAALARIKHAPEPLDAVESRARLDAALAMAG